MPRKIARLVQHATLEPIVDSDELVSASVGPDGDVYALWASSIAADQLLMRMNAPAGGSMPNTRTAEPVAVTITAHSPVRRLVAKASILRVKFPFLQPLPDGKTLIVGSRARLRPPDPELNGVVVDADGRIVVEATVGDGIEDVQTTIAGDVWVSFFDEGAVGDTGLIRLDSDLQQQWEFPVVGHELWGSITDCYAMNVTGNAAWICYYTDFPIVRVEEETITGWLNQVSGVQAIVVRGEDRVMLVGGYQEMFDRVVDGQLCDGQFEAKSTQVLVLPHGDALPSRETRYFGRGPDLFVLVGRECYRMSEGDG